MKCRQCKKEIKSEIKMVRVSDDADFVCDEKCKVQYEKDRDEFFNNIGNEKWYNEWWEK